MARWPTSSFKTGRTGCYRCMRMSSADGGCGTKNYPCVHWGIDLFADDPRVVAPEAGEVLAVADGSLAPYRGYGPGVVLLYGKSGYYHLLSHLSYSSIVVKKGEWISEGALIGSFDRAYGHTHYEVRIQPTGESSVNTVDPEAWLLSQSVKLRSVPWALIGVGVGGLLGAAMLSRIAQRRAA